MKMRVLGAVVGPALLMSALTAATPTLAEMVTVDVGNGMTVKVDPSKPLNIAFFEPVANTSYVQANIKGAQDAAKKYGASISVFDGKISPTTQGNQVQNALQSKKYQGFVIFPVAGQLLCKAATEDAPKAGILVTVFQNPVCDKATAVGEDQWAPGTVEYVGGAESVDAVIRLLDLVAERNPGEHKLGIFTGDELDSNTARMTKALEGFKVKHPNLQVVDVRRTDYTVPTSMQRAQNMIQSHPDIDIVVTNYSNITRGAVDALQAAGKIGKVKVYDIGGTSWAKKAIENGWIELTVPMYAYSIGYVATENLIKAYQGKSVPRYVPNDGGPVDAPFTIDKTNVAQFQPESD